MGRSRSRSRSRERRRSRSRSRDRKRHRSRSRSRERYSRDRGEIEATAESGIMTATAAALEAEVEIAAEEKNNLISGTTILINQMLTNRQLELQSSKHGNSKSNKNQSEHLLLLQQHLNRPKVLSRQH